MDGQPFAGKGVTSDGMGKRDEAFGYADRFDERYEFAREALELAPISTFGHTSISIRIPCKITIVIACLLFRSGAICIVRVN